MIGKKVCIFPMGPPYQLIHDCRNRFPLYDKSLRLPSKTNITLVHKIPMKNYKDDSRKTFDKVAIKYESSYFGRQARRLYDKVVIKVEQFNHEFILDLGCGKGNLLEKLKKYNSRLYGADISAEMIKYARERLGIMQSLTSQILKAYPGKIILLISLYVPFLFITIPIRENH
jgi:SAM-dependent methyltransferase